MILPRFKNRQRRQRRTSIVTLTAPLLVASALSTGNALPTAFADQASQSNPFFTAQSPTTRVARENQQTASTPANVRRIGANTTSRPKPNLATLPENQNREPLKPKRLGIQPASKPDTQSISSINPFAANPAGRSIGTQTRTTKRVDSGIAFQTNPVLRVVQGTATAANNKHQVAQQPKLPPTTSIPNHTPEPPLFDNRFIIQNPVVSTPAVQNNAAQHSDSIADPITATAPVVFIVPESHNPETARPIASARATTKASLASANVTNRPQPLASTRHASRPHGPLQSITAQTCDHRASEALIDARHEYAIGAYASAEASAWRCLQLLCSAIDLHDTQRSIEATAWAVQRLSKARTTLDESQDFASPGRPITPELVSEIIRSHQSKAVIGDATARVTSTQALDLYLESARIDLVPIARRHVGAAQAMDLIASIRLQRSTPNPIPEETALCLRRAALEGQPSNTSLALQLGAQLSHMGLLDEAQATLTHAMNLSPSQSIAEALNDLQRKRIGNQAVRQVVQSRTQQRPAARAPQVTQLTPAEFAAISPQVNNTTNQTARSVPAQTVANRQAPSASGNTAAQTVPFKQASQRPLNPPAQLAQPAKTGFWSQLFKKNANDQP